MRSTTVPAQITTVEDRITGSLSLSQLLLLVTPVFVGSALFVILPPFFSYAPYKLVLMTILAACCGVLAIRVRGRILLSWILAVARYRLRPRYYVFSKNSGHLREYVDLVTPELATQPVVDQANDTTADTRQPLNTADKVRIESIIHDPKANLHFTVTKKGKLRAHFTEVQS